MLSFLPLFGAVEVLSLKKKILIIVNSFRIGGRASGKPLRNSHLRVLYLIIMFKTQETLKEESSLANLSSGVKL